MHYTKLFIHAALLLTTPPYFLFSNTQPTPLSIPPEARCAIQPCSSSDLPVTYDDLLQFINDLESGELEKRCSPEELEAVCQFVVNLTRVGVLPGEEEELEKDIQELLSEDGDSTQSFSYDEDFEYLITPAVFSGEREIHLCGNWVKKQLKRVKKFAKKHKKALVVGAAAIVVIVAVGLIVPAAPGAAAAGAAAAGASQSDDDGEEDEFEEPSPPTEAPTAVFKETITEHLAILKDAVVEENLLPTPSAEDPDAPTLVEKTRNLGALLAHHVFDGVADLGAIIPLMGDAFQTKDSLQESASFTEGYYEILANGHEKIDQFFSTNQAARFSQPVKEALEKRSSIGEIPPPSCLFEAVGATARSIASAARFRTAIQAGADAAIAAEELGLSAREIIQLERSGALEKTVATRFEAMAYDAPLANLLEAGKVLDRANLTKAGRALMKHGYREGSVFPKPLGNPEQINAQGQVILESIINHPEKTIYERPHPNFGTVIDVVVPGRGGARFTTNGEMIGFLEP